jgi:hypothetical protein
MAKNNCQEACDQILRYGNYGILNRLTSHLSIFFLFPILTLRINQAFALRFPGLPGVDGGLASRGAFQCAHRPSKRVARGR